MQDVRLGKIRRAKAFGRTLYISPDVWTWLMPTTITVLLALGVLVVTKPSASLLEQSLFSVLTVAALAFSLMCGLTDPGVAPRPAPGYPDPNEGDASLKQCDFCRMRRPPRTNHCHVCNVCVLEHDHHCGVIGGCVGLRSLRWFTSYLTCIGVASGYAVMMIIRGLVLVHRVKPNAKDRWVVGGTDDGRDMAYLVVLLIFVGNIFLIVGCLAVYYIFLVSTDTTRREAQRGKSSSGSVGESAALWLHEERAGELRARWSWRYLGRLGRVFCPPPSLLELALNPRPPMPDRAVESGDGTLQV